MKVPEELQYTKEHEWVRHEGERVTIGITDFAQGELGDVVYVELPAVGAKVTRLAQIGTIESVKAVSELYAPVSGEVVDVNSELEAHPELVNSDPYGGGWMIAVRVDDWAADQQQLLAAADYQQLSAG